MTPNIPGFTATTRHRQERQKAAGPKSDRAQWCAAPLRPMVFANLESTPSIPLRDEKVSCNSNYTLALLRDGDWTHPMRPVSIVVEASYTAAGQPCRSYWCVAPWMSYGICVSLLWLAKWCHKEGIKMPVSLYRRRVIVDFSGCSRVCL